jgi:hypothetical protein
MFSIDGTENEIGVISLKRKADFLAKYAERTEDGVLHKELIGVYFNYQLRLGWNIKDPKGYDNMWEILSQPREFHSLSLPYGSSGRFSFSGYCSNLQRDLFLVHNGNQYWKGLTVNFTAEKPALTVSAGLPVIPPIPIEQFVSLKQKAEFLDGEGTGRTQDGALHRKLIGTYFNHQLKLKWSYNNDEWYHNFWDKISAPVEFNTVTIPDGYSDSLTYKAYCSNVGDDLFLHRDGKHYWRNLTVNFIAESPARS